MHTKKENTKQRRTGLVGSASGWGAQIRETAKGPSAMQERNLTNKLNNHHISSYWTTILHPNATADELDIPPGEQTLPLIIPHLEKLSEAIQNVMRDKEFPCAIGGDHVMGVGTFSGAIKHLDAQENFGLIWVDAHMDSHIPETSPSNAYHGMPVASLLGYGEPQLANLTQEGAKIRPQDLALIGIRSFEPEEEELLQRLNVKIFYSDDVLARGFETVIQEAIVHVSRHTKAFGVSIDLDAFDPKHAPGVGSPEADGLIPEKTLPYLHYVRNHPHFAALEITEFNPERDEENLTATLIEDILKEILPR
ncbi:MAG: arginase [Alphaproteobacteria bacterium]|nr:arginase [Alphaproteobacteria bacterium]NCQ67284.1 arginase [Alphaproteobacteria bacterium]NCT06749.1 arginase [Alphaproteobacteria bacterium]